MLNLRKYAGEIEQYRVILANKRHQHFGELLFPEALSIKVNLNAADEISFTIYKTKEYLWDDVQDFAYVYIPELGEHGEYFEIQVSIADGAGTVKNVIGSSACEVELGQVLLFDFEVNSEVDIDRDDYVVTKFYDPDNPKGSLLNRVLYKLPNYSIGHVDETIMNMQRTFSESGTSVYDFLTQTVADEFNCLFLFDSVNRTISAYDLLTTCMHQIGETEEHVPVYCMERGDFYEKCPKCGNTDISEMYFYGNDTTVYIDSENLASTDVVLDTDKDSVKNCFRLVAGDDDMTAAVRSCNPNGSDYIYYFSDEQKSMMSAELVDALNDYDALWESYQDDYQTVMQNLYEAYDKILYYQTSMMPQPDDDDDEHEESEIDERENTHRQIGYLSQENLSPIGIDKLNQYTSQSVIEYAITDYSKVFVSSAYYKVTVATEDDWGDYLKDQEHYPDYIDPALHPSDLNAAWDYEHRTWTGRLKVVNYNDRNNPGFTHKLTITVVTEENDVAEFTRQKIDKLLIKYDDLARGEYSDDERYIFNVLRLNTSAQLDKFRAAIQYYSLDMLTSFLNAITTCMDTLMEMGLEHFQFNDGGNAYIPYQDYYNMKVACEEEMSVRSATIKEWEDVRDQCLEDQENIQEVLDFEDYLGDELLNEFAAWRREDEYNNSNYISDDVQVNEDLFARAQEFLEKAKKELVKASTTQYSISTSLNNLLAIREFYPLSDGLNLGDWIRVGVDGKVFRLRLISYQIDFSNINQLSVEFADVTKAGISNPYMELRNTIEQAKSMATSYSALTTQVNKGVNSIKVVNKWIDDGFDLTQNKIVNDADLQGVTIDNHGILARRYNEFQERFEPEQLKIVNNGMYITDDSWHSIKTAVGKYYYTDPSTQEEIAAYGILAETIVGKLIIGNSLEIESLGIDPETGQPTNVLFKVDGSGVTINSGLIRANKTSINDPTPGFYIDTDGSINIGSATQYLKLLSNGNVVLRGSMITIGGDDIEEIVSDLEEQAVTGVTPEYGVSNSDTVGPDPDDPNAWSTTPPQKQDGQYIWERTVTTNMNGDRIYKPSKQGVCITGKDGEDALSVVVESSAGNIFKGGNTNTILTCYVYKGVTDITNQYNQFTWKKKDAYGVIDPSWVYVTVSNTKAITSSDVVGKAIFICEPDII